MNDLISTLLRWLARALLWAAGLLFFLSVLGAALLLALLWAVRALWARLTGRPVAQWRMPIDPRTGWQRAQRAPRWGAAEPPQGPSRRMGVLPGADSVTDVVAHEPRSGSQEPPGPSGPTP